MGNSVIGAIWKAGRIPELLPRQNAESRVYKLEKEHSAFS